MTTSRRFLPGFALLATVLFAPLAATPVPPGTSVPLNGATNATNPQWPGTIGNDGNLQWEIRNDSGTVILTGTIQNRVVFASTTGEINISPILRNLASPTGSARVLRYVTEDFGGYKLNIEYSLSGLGEVGPSQVTRSSGEGESLDFDFSANPLAPPDESRFMIISVNTLAYSLDGTATIYAEESPDGPVFSTQVPGVAVPLSAGPEDLQIVSIDRREDGRIELEWMGIPNRWHEIHYSANAKVWTKLRDSFQEDHSVKLDIFTPPGGPDTQYYRVILP